MASPAMGAPTPRRDSGALELGDVSVEVTEALDPRLAVRFVPRRLLQRLRQAANTREFERSNSANKKSQAGGAGAAAGAAAAAAAAAAASRLGLDSPRVDAIADSAVLLVEVSGFAARQARNAHDPAWQGSDDLTEALDAVLGGAEKAVWHGFLVIYTHCLFSA